MVMPRHVREAALCDDSNKAGDSLRACGERGAEHYKCHIMSKFRKTFEGQWRKINALLVDAVSLSFAQPKTEETKPKVKTTEPRWKGLWPQKPMEGQKKSSRELKAR